MGKLEESANLLIVCLNTIQRPNELTVLDDASKASPVDWTPIRYPTCY